MEKKRRDYEDIYPSSPISSRGVRAGNFLFISGTTVFTLPLRLLKFFLNFLPTPITLPRPIASPTSRIRRMKGLTATYLSRPLTSGI